MEFETEWKINGLNQQYARCLDEGRYEEWPTFFVEDAMYAIHSRENADAGLEGYIMYCEGGPMLRDRILATEKVLVHDLRFERRIVTDVVVKNHGDDVIEARANYLMVRTDLEGRSELFSAGEYRDKIVFDDEGNPKFQERIVVPDTFNIVGTCPYPI